MFHIIASSKMDPSQLYRTAKIPLPPEQVEQLTTIIQHVCQYYKIKQSDIESSRRDEHLVKARSLLYCLLREKSSLSLDQIGELFNRTHATVIHGIRLGKDRYKADLKKLSHGL